MFDYILITLLTFFNLFLFSNIHLRSDEPFEFVQPMEVRYIRAFGDTELSPPVIFIENPNIINRNTNSINNKVVNIELDLFSTKTPSLYVKFVHCNFDWTESENVFLNDVTNRSSNIEIYNAPVYSDYFTHRAKIQIPNFQVKFKFAGNWKAIFYDYDNNEKIAEARFFVVNTLVNTDLQIHTDFYNSNFKVTNTAFILDANITTKSNLLENQLHSAVFYTNNRWFEPYIVTNSNQTNEYYNIQKKYRYNFTASNRGFISFGRTFRIAGIPAENCYRVLDLSNTTQFPRLLSGSSRMNFPDLIRNGNCLDYDSDGALQNGFSQPDIDDYVNIEFLLDPMNNISKDFVFLSGTFNNFRPNKDWIMNYDKETNKYRLKQWVRRGKHNYLYSTGKLNVDDNYAEQFSYDYFEGNSALSNHTYYVFVYYKEIENGGYDSIVGVGVNSNR